ncbi:hypothetical protein [Spinactinospora alkalitolerans]|uniref:hypothetical protein n=1 Tax=Spinactinospora alkalitolerans TaxID=687207 RepID=UPI001FE2BEB1|nr:hypothetical protein [Spinactinospora alkalitolerans]
MTLDGRAIARQILKPPTSWPRACSFASASAASNAVNHTAARSGVHTTALGRLPALRSTSFATLTVISCCFTADDSAERRVARIRCCVAGPTTRLPFTDARTSGSSDARAFRIRSFSASIASNIAATWSTRNRSSSTCPRCGFRYRRPWFS